MAGLIIRSTVHASGDVSAELAARADEVVLVVETAADPCPMCARNSDSEEPRRPPLHRGCRCVAIETTIGEIFTEHVG